MSDNVINTPVEEPVVEETEPEPEPVVEESLVEEPVVEEPVLEESEPEPEPVAEEPVVEESEPEPEPVAEEPVANVEVDRLTALENKVNNLVNILNNSYYQRLNNDDILEWKNNLLLVREDLARL